MVETGQTPSHSPERRTIMSFTGRFSNSPSSLSFAVSLLLGAVATSYSSAIEVGKGPITVKAMELKKVPPVQASASLSAETPPLEGSFGGVVLTITDQRSDETDSFASVHSSLSGNPLSVTATNHILAILDSGAATTLIGYENAAAMGLEGNFLVSGGGFPVGGAVGSMTLAVSMPIGLFAHGLQHLSSSGGMQASLFQGQGNFSAGVNTRANFLSGNTIPTVIGAPFFSQFVAVFRNSQLVAFPRDNSMVRSPSVDLFADPLDPLIPNLDWEIDLGYTPAASVVSYFQWVDTTEFTIIPLLPSFIGAMAGALYETQNNVQLEHDGNAATGPMLVDTAALGTFISEAAATQLGLVLLNPDFEVEVGGIGGTTIRPGFYVDSMNISAQPTSTNLPATVEWNNVPIIVSNITGPAGRTIFGIFGMNLLGARDYVFDGVSAPPQLKISRPFVPPDLQISEITFAASNNTIEVDWLTQPAPPALVLEKSENIGDPSPTWTAIATGELSSVTGMMSVTGAGNSTVFRLTAP